MSICWGWTVVVIVDAEGCPGLLVVESASWYYVLYMYLMASITRRAVVRHFKSVLSNAKARSAFLCNHFCNAYGLKDGI